LSLTIAAINAPGINLNAINRLNEPCPGDLGSKPTQTYT
jgi:hypothetical protein